MLHLSLISRQLLPRPASYSYRYCRFRFVSRASAVSSRKELLNLKRRDDAIRKAAARLCRAEPEKPLVDWKSLWWVGLVPLMGVGALAAADETLRDQILSGSRIYNYFTGGTSN